MARGDHVYVWRGFYYHHGVDVGDDEVIHFCGEPSRPMEKVHATICRTALDNFARGAPICVQEYAVRLSADEAVERAESRLGEQKYDLLGNNCEHFARWCVTGKAQSAQVHGVAAGTGVVGVSGAAAAGGLGVVAAAGEVAGLSGGGIMSGLATAGGVLGGGAVVGAVALGAAPAVASVAIINKALKDDEALTEGERAARRAGRQASLAGAATGSVAGVGAISAVGVSGLSAAGITSGLAGIGATVGGGMAAGTMLVVAAPAAIAAGLGYSVYRLMRRQTRHRVELIDGRATTSDE